MILGASLEIVEIRSQNLKFPNEASFIAQLGYSQYFANKLCMITTSSNIFSKIYDI